LNWLNNFLTNRSLSVKVENAISNSRTLHKGVPQGSVLSPLLFNIMMADIPQPGPRDKLSLFADDIVIYTTTPSKPEAQPILQRYLNRIEHWANTWKFKFSVAKCAIISFTRKRLIEIDPVIYLNGTRITLVNQYKYLGVILDSKLNWDAHSNHILHIINRKANLLKLLMSGKSTLNTGLLIRIYKALIRSKIDYGSIVLSSMNKSKLLKLEKSQNTILRNILVCLKFTPTALIYIESGLTPIKHGWDLISSRYLMKLNERTGNPAYTTLYNLTLNTTGWKMRSTPAVIPHLKMIQTNIQEAFTTVPNRLPWTESLPPWQLFEIKTQLLPISKKVARNNLQLTQELFRKSTENTTESTLLIFTDGSCHQLDKVSSCAFFIPKLQERKAWELGNYTTSFNAELAAIQQSLKFIYPLDWQDIIIITDSKSAIQAVAHFKWEASSLIPEIIELIKNLKSAGTQITFLWIPSHSGIYGNEIADELANKTRTDPDGLTMTYTPNIKESLSKLKNKHKQETFVKIKALSTNLSVTNRIDMKILPWLTHKKRYIQIALLRLRSGHNRLNYFTNKWNTEISPFCASGCLEIENNIHVLIECPHHASARTSLMDFLISQKLPLDVPTITGLNHSIPKHTQKQIAKLLISYLTETKLINRL
jgi:ribonuclease HI